MLRGCQKKIIYLKNTGSDVFDEAYFIVGERAIGAGMRECDMVEEANRILDECFSKEEKCDFKQKTLAFLKAKTIPFITGMIIGIICVLLIK